MSENHSKFTHISGPAVDALERRKESDNGPSEAQVTADAAKRFHKFGPPEWSRELIERVLEMGREK